MIRVICSVALIISLSGCSNHLITSDEDKVVSQPAQEKAVISGVVKNDSKPVVGMLVEISSGDCFSGPVLSKTYTDAQGAFRFKQMTPDTYYIGVNDFRGSGDFLPEFKGFCDKGRYFTGTENLHFQIPVDKRE